MESQDADLRTIDPEGEGRSQEGERLDRLLARELGLSRAAVRRILGTGSVSINGRVVGTDAKGRPVAPSDLVQFRAEGADPHALPRSEPDASLEVLATDDGWIAVDKRAGQAVHPYGVEEGGTVLNALIAHEPQIAGVGEGGLRSGVVHRLDVDTSGVLLFALDELRWSQAREAFSSGSARKRYRALVAGHLEGQGSERFDLYVARHRPAQVRVATGETRQKSWPTTLRWRSLETFRDATLVEVSPRTGFLHQIRVSLAELGHPVIGDPVYGGVEGAFAARTGLQPRRHLLHAASLAIPALDVSAQAEDPDDFGAAIATLREA